MTLRWPDDQFSILFFVTSQSCDQVAEMIGRAQLGSLEVLSVAGAYRLDDKGLQAVLKATPKLLVLGLQDSCRLQDSISVLPSCCPSLKAGPFRHQKKPAQM